MTSNSLKLVLSLFMVPHLALSATPIPVPNGSFEDVDTLQFGGVWPEADVDPVNADFWLEPGPASDDLAAFPPSLIPPGFTPPEGATLDTGVFFNAEFGQDPSTGEAVPNPAFVTNADGNQLAYLFAKDDLEPPIGFLQQLSSVYTTDFEYSLVVGVGKSFFLPPTGGDGGDPTAVLRLFFEDDVGQNQAVAQTEVAVSDIIEATSLGDFAVRTALVEDDDPWRGRPIGIELAPLDGTSGAWIFDNVRLTAVPEPQGLMVLGLVFLFMRGRGRAGCAGRLALTRRVRQ